MGSSTYSYLVAFSAAMGGLLFGYEIGVISQTISMDSFGLFFGLLLDVPDKDDPRKLAKSSQKAFIDGMVTFMFLLGCSIGALFVSWLADAWGRKKSIMAAGAVFLLGGAIQSFAPNSALFFVGRVVGGLAIGVLSMCAPLYIAEAAPTSIRGRMIAIQQLMITIGILVASIINTIIISSYKHTLTDGAYVGNKYNHSEWRLALGMQCLPAFILVLVTSVMPESPRWLASKNRDRETLEVLAKLRAAPPSDASVQHEYKEIVDGVLFERSVGEGGWGEVFGPGIGNRTIRCIILQFFQQWTGINVILYYQSDLLQGMGLDKEQATTTFTIANNVVNVIATFPGMYLIERMGRRRLLIIGGLFMGLAHYAVCLFVTLGNNAVQDLPLNQKSSPFFYLAIASVYAFIIGFASTWGPITWVYQSEVFPQRVRGKGTGISTFSNWAGNAIVALITPIITENVKEKMYLIFGSACIIMAVFTFGFIPETMGKSLEDMDELFGSSNQSRIESGNKK